MNHLDCLPNELLEAVCQCLAKDTRSLAQLCKVSTRFLAIAWPILYTTLDLNLMDASGRMKVPPLRSLSSTLSTRPHVAQRVQTLRLNAMGELLETLPLSMTAFANMKNLKTLGILDDGFRHLENAVKEQLMNIWASGEIRHLEVFPFYHDTLDPASFPSSQWAKLHGLESLRWVPHTMTHRSLALPCPATLSLISNSHASIHTLALRVPLEEHFCQLRFPRLRNLDLSLQFGFQRPTLALYNFLHTHTLIEHLAIELVDVISCVVLGFAEDCLEVFTPTTLPRFQRFRGSTQSLRMLVKAKLKSLTRLKDLNIGLGYSGLEEQISLENLMQELMFSPIQLESLKTLSLQPTLDAVVTTFHCGRLWGNTVESWTGFLPGFDESYTLHEMANLFRPFTKLLTIHLRCGDTTHPESEPVRERIQHLAFEIPSLSSVVIDPDGQSKATRVWCSDFDNFGDEMM